MTEAINDEYKSRLNKLEKIKSEGINPYPDKFTKRQTIAQALAADLGTTIKTAGRILTIREMGKICFCHVSDDSDRMQIVLKQDNTDLKEFLKIFDPADFIGVEGELFKTNKGEVSILVKKYTLLSKALRPLPEKFHGLADQETKYRERYLDLASSRETFDRFIFRSKFVKALREFYWSQGFIELETPILVNNASGALAKPFVTHHNALDIDVYLRIAPEIYLKEALIGGFEKVFEIGRCFRNEGIDPSHLQDFTMCEHYASYWNFEDNMKFTEKMFTHLLTKIFGSLKIKIKDRQGKLEEIDFKTPWPKVSFADLIKKDSGIDVTEFATAEKLRVEIKAKKIKIGEMEKLERGSLIDALYKAVSRDKIIFPTFVINHPTDLSPLARQNDKNSSVVDRFQLLVNTWEIINAYSELIDPVEQKKRFDNQASAKAAGDAEAHGKDDEFIKALEHGMPPASGWGMGIDRIVSLLTQQDNLRDVVMFPLMRPEK